VNIVLLAEFLQLEAQFSGVDCCAAQSAVFRNRHQADYLDVLAVGNGTGENHGRCEIIAVHDGYEYFLENGLLSHIAIYNLNKE